MALFQPKQATIHVPIFGADEVADVTGAGDTVIATLATLIAAGLSPRDAVPIANRAAGIVVRKFGTAAIGYEELFG
jgi:bifunctional ADP-heptose synthase (sugar kinase/adenylyltransferase)